MLGEEDSPPNPANTDPPCQCFHVLNPADTDLLVNASMSTQPTDLRPHILAYNYGKGN
jgi:hypothetical protein